MKRIQNRLGAMFTAAVMLLSLAVTPAMAADTKAPPTAVTNCEVGGSVISNTILALGFSDSDWMNAISTVKVGDDAYTKGTVSSFSNTGIWESGTYSFNGGAQGDLPALKFALNSGTTFPVTIVLSAEGYKDLTVKVTQADKWGDAYTAEAVVNSDSGNGGSGSTETPDTSENGTVAVSDVTIVKDNWNSNWVVSFTDADGYVSQIQTVKVNDTEWTSTSYGPYSGGSYKKNIDENTLAFAQNDNLVNPAISALKSGDVITITATGYKDLTFKLVIDKNGNASVSPDTESGDPYELHVKIEGSFEAAIVGQKDYDGVSSASVGGASSNKNSAVTVYGALVEQGTEPAEDDWEELDHQSEINLEGSKCSVSIVPDTANGTKSDADSGMKGVYMTLSSDLTLNGTPKDAGNYLVSVHIEDDQGRTADSNALPFRIYTGEETLAEQIKTENLKQYSNGLYAWDIMEPWAIKNFGSNVTDEENSVRVPKDLEVWYGSHKSGTYGVLGYDIAWENVKKGNIPQTLYIPNGCDLTLMNMKVLSSVRIVVENGGKLTLRDSTVQGIIDVQSGGTFSMNYDSYKKAFETGASICGQLRLADGAILENAAIYSHTNYLANGDRTDRSNDDAVVAASGNVTVKGQVFIQGDEAGSTMKGQTALIVSNGTLTLADDAVLVTYGGGGNVTLYSNGGSAVELDNGKIAGKGKLVAIGGSVLFGSGDEAVAGTGSIDVSEVFLQGATAYELGKGAQPGKAYAADVTVKADKQHIADGTLVDGAANDPLKELYWKSGLDKTPDLTKFETKVAETPAAPGTNGNGSGSSSGSSGSSGSKHKTSKSSTTAASRAFEDVSADAYYNGAVEWAVKSGITNGKTDGLFGSNDPCTRGQIVTFLWRAAGSPEVKSMSSFVDVADSAYYAKAVAWAVENGITGGTGATTFSAEAVCTRAQIVTFLWRANGSPIVSGNSVFGDVAADAYYAAAVKWAEKNGITGGIGGGLFGSDNDCTRAQIVTFIWRCMK